MERKRLAVLVGCNYPGTKNELHGCINDAVRMHEILVQRFEFVPSDIVMLTDAENGIVDKPEYPSGENIQRALSNMIDQAEPCDVLVFHFSGHGVLLDDQHDDGIFPSDGNIITDHDFRNLVNRLPKGAMFTILSDSCHSGGLIDKEKEQIGDDMTDNGDQVTNNSGGNQEVHHRMIHRPFLLFSHNNHHNNYKARGIEHGDIMKHLRSKSGLNSDNIGDHLVHIYGDKASSVFRDKDLLQRKVKLHPDNGILLSGCQHDEMSADVIGDEPHGAFTSALLSVLKEHDGPISNEELVRLTRSKIKEPGRKQHPCLYSSDSNKDAPFLFEGVN